MTTVEVVIRDLHFKFETEPELFSPHDVDRGTLALLAAVPLLADDKVLDLGCGYGVMGIYAAKQVNPAHVVMVDNDPAAVECAKRNARLNNVESTHVRLSDGLSDLDDKDFTKILCNPPYHRDFAVPKRFIEKGFNRLTVGGSMWMVTKREEWYRNKLTSIFGGVRVSQRDGYFVFTAIKKGSTYANRKR